MKKKKIFKIGIIFITVLATIAGSIMADNAVREQKNLEYNAPNSRTDIIIIDTMKIFGSLERPPVEFFHDSHTNNLEKKDKNCTACHLINKSNNRLSVKFKRINDSNKKEVTDIYHTNCIACHRQTLNAGKKSGPLVCGECHKIKPTAVSMRAEIGFDKSLHYRHSKAYNDKCKKCHHQYNEKTKKLFYVKNKEESCRSCHKSKTEENRVSLSIASHTSCVNCHKERVDRKKEAGPVKCSGCHDLKNQKKNKKVIFIPRMKRKQPDVSLIKTGDNVLDKKHKPRMNFVPFDHKAHENYNNTCRICHHTNMKQCSKCHTAKGSKEGNHINLATAMHKEESMQSCIGCHKKNQLLKECAGCHTFLGKKQNKDTTTCKKCHMDSLNTKKNNDKMVAAKLLNSRDIKNVTYNLNDIPEKVIIKELSKEYEPVNFPHRKIVRKIMENIKDNKIAGYFHDNKGTICAGCHHNSPISKKPTRCINCHGEPFNETDIHKPGLKGAYHRQCMECHDNMKLADLNSCKKCHKKK